MLDFHLFVVSWMFALWILKEKFLLFCLTLFDVWQKGGEKVWVCLFILFVVWCIWVFDKTMCFAFEFFTKLCVFQCLMYLALHWHFWYIALFEGELSKLFFHFCLNNLYVLSSSKRGRLLAQGYNHPFLLCFDDYKTY